jgi:hypothetical protein
MGQRAKMLKISAKTIENLYQAQRPEVRNLLRLDISSTRRPTDLLSTEPDVEAASHAIGERVIRLLKGCVGDAFVLGGHKSASGFDEAAVPPKLERNNRIRILHNKEHFEKFVLRRLNGVLGLDPGKPSYKDAVTALACDLLLWIRQGSEAPRIYGIEAKGNDVFVRCEPQDSPFSDIDAVS